MKLIVLACATMRFAPRSIDYTQLLPNPVVEQVHPTFTNGMPKQTDSSYLPAVRAMNGHILAKHNDRIYALLIVSAI